MEYRELFLYYRENNIVSLLKQLIPRLWFGGTIGNGEDCGKLETTCSG